MTDTPTHPTVAGPVSAPTAAIEANGINVIAESERKGTPRTLFWPWCASNISVFGVAYGSYFLGFGVSFWQATIAGLLGTVLSFVLVGLVSLAGKRGSAPTMVLSRAAFGVRGNAAPTGVSWVLFVGWEGVGLCSYLLIGFWFSEKANADAGKKAFIVNRIGDFGFLVALMMLFAHLGTMDFQGVAAGAPQMSTGVVTAICLFLFLGCVGKSAQIPLYVWLPDAMAGPTPVSALIHAATMVTAGVYLVARSSFLFSLAPVAGLTVALTGAVTALFAATIGLKQWDIKKILAYSTVSQLGFMFMAVGVGAYVARHAAVHHPGHDAQGVQRVSEMHGVANGDAKS